MDEERGKSEERERERERACVIYSPKVRLSVGNKILISKYFSCRTDVKPKFVRIKMSEKEIVYSILPRNRIGEVNELLLDQFFANKPLGVALGAVPDEHVRPWINKVTKPILDQQVNFQ